MVPIWSGHLSQQIGAFRSISRLLIPAFLSLTQSPEPVNGKVSCAGQLKPTAGEMMGSLAHPHMTASLVLIPLQCLILLIRAISLWAVVYFTHQMPDEIFRHRELGPITTNS